MEKKVICGKLIPTPTQMGVTEHSGNQGSAFTGRGEDQEEAGSEEQGQPEVGGGPGGSRLVKQEGGQAQSLPFGG